MTSRLAKYRRFFRLGQTVWEGPKVSAHFETAWLRFTIEEHKNGEISLRLLTNVGVMRIINFTPEEFSPFRDAVDETFARLQSHEAGHRRDT